jgi:flagellar biosynthetic protein FliP
MIPMLLSGKDPAFFEINVNNFSEPEQLVQILNISVVLGFLFLLPTLLLMMTTFTRFIIVFSLLKQALGLQQIPPAKVLTGIALIMTMFLMKPIGMKSYEEGIVPYIEKEIGYKVAFDKTIAPFKKFMQDNTREKDLALFYRINNIKNTKIKDIPLLTLLPAFIISELRTAFEIGILLFIPFVIIDVIVSTILMSLGMMMLPPSLISMPVKIAFFVLLDGWNLIIGQLANSFIL